MQLDLSPADVHQQDGDWGLLLQLPQDIFVNHVLLPYLSPRDKQALRQASR